MTTKNLFCFVLLALATAGCSSESLNVQRQFPFTLSSEALPGTTRPNVAVPFKVTITPQRLASSTVYQLKWRSLSDEMPTIRLDNVPLPPNVFIRLNTLRPVLIFSGPAPASYKFEVIVANEVETSQQLSFQLSVATK